ncbi:Holliday junction branch migration protein RuvA [Candidatus Nomurabacteria bacterium]|nr:Holliday junction branch migration protein RuvA [Candidatus Nomurabacteria bacterium]
MFAFITGKIREVSAEGKLIVMVGGLGFEVQLNQRDQLGLEIGQIVELYIYEHIREDQFGLYGFVDSASKEIFVRLIGVSGVGPKVALAIVSSNQTDQLVRAIEDGDPRLFEQVSGVGKRTAQKIILDLRGKLVIADQKQASNSLTQPLAQALEQLGYKPAQIKQVTGIIDPELSLSDQVKQALKELRQ